MTEITPTTSVPLPLPSVSMTTRLATMDDLPLIDALQYKHFKQLGFFPRAQMEEYIRGGWVMVAEGDDCGLSIADCGLKEKSSSSNPQSEIGNRQLLGYCASRDRYLKRDELGAIFQMCVEPGRQRGFIGANLLKAVFDRAPYGCKLYCCWCAQDLAANKFWEAMGFVPLAFRAGSEKKSRVHIFWQKRIRQHDTTTPWWFPSSTSGGALRGDRIVLPIPLGTHWSDALPMIYPELTALPASQSKAIPGPRVRPKKAAPPPEPLGMARGGLRFTSESESVTPPQPKSREKKPRAKFDPKVIAAARELRDRWIEQADAALMIGTGKYNLVRAERPKGLPPTDLPRLAA